VIPEYSKYTFSRGWAILPFKYGDSTRQNLKNTTRHSLIVGRAMLTPCSFSYARLIPLFSLSYLLPSYYTHRGTRPGCSHRYSLHFLSKLTRPSFRTPVLKPSHFSLNSLPNPTPPMPHHHRPWSCKESPLQLFVSTSTCSSLRCVRRVLGAS
jgi:hypothetical protein